VHDSPMVKVIYFAIGLIKKTIMIKNGLCVAILGVSISLLTFNASFASGFVLKEKVSDYKEGVVAKVIAAEDVITIKVVVGEMRFDKAKFAVKAGTTVKIVVDNPDFMQHNFLLLKPGTLEKVGNAADALAGMANGAELQYVPKIPEVLASTPLLNQGEKFELTVKVPATPGDYPFVCTFPGHWRMMHGIMTVTE